MLLVIIFGQEDFWVGWKTCGQKLTHSARLVRDSDSQDQLYLMCKVPSEQQHPL